MKLALPSPGYRSREACVKMERTDGLVVDRGKAMSKVRGPAVAGQFYPADPEKLKSVIGRFMDEVLGSDDLQVPRAIIAPHAGYVYSGAIAASAYAHVAAGRGLIRRVVLLGPAHRVPVQGVAASSAQAFSTPLGQVPLDRPAIKALLGGGGVSQHDEAHAPEHGLEVHLPFLQEVLGAFHLVPLIVGEVPAEEVAHVLQDFAVEPHTLIVVSSDLSHYNPYEIAMRRDRETSLRIERLQPLAAGQACGRCAINGLLHLARLQGWEARTLLLRNSGDAAGSRDQVVGYGAYLFN